MRLVKQKVALDVKNLDDNLSSSDKQKRRHSKILPNTIRCVICGPSNCGKTNALLSLITEGNGLKFNNIYVYSKSLYQPKYQFLEKVIDNVKGVNYFKYSENENIIDPSDALENSIFIFDDVACDKQDKIRSYFSMGRHKAVDSFYLCQSYTRIPKHMIRDNVNFIILFKQDDLNLRHVYEDHVGTDMTFGQFKSVCGECWKNKYDFLVIDKDSDMREGRYRKMFDSYIYL